MCVFRFKLWWMTQRMGTSGKDIPFETQFLIVEGQDGSHFGEDGEDKSALYVVFLPILEGDFRAVLQGNANNELEICLESGKRGCSFKDHLDIFCYLLCQSACFGNFSNVVWMQEILLFKNSKGVI